MIPYFGWNSPRRISELHSLERPDLFQVVALDDGPAAQQVGGGAPQAARVLRQHVAQGYVAASLGLVAGGVFFAEVFGLDDDVRYGGVLWLVVGLSLVGSSLFCSILCYFRLVVRSRSVQAHQQRS